MADLGEARKKIDRIDEELVKLFLERLAVAREVALAKRENGGSVTDPAREREILSRVSEAAGPDPMAEPLIDVDPSALDEG